MDIRVSAQEDSAVAALQPPCFEVVEVNSGQGEEIAVKQPGDGDDERENLA